MAVKNQARGSKAEEITKEQLLEGLEAHKKDHAARINKVKGEIAALNAEEETARLEKEINEAIEAFEADKAVKLQKDLEEIKARREVLGKMLEKAEAMPLCPREWPAEEWRRICEEMRKEWNERIKAVTDSTEAYNKACERLMLLKNALMGARVELERIHEYKFETVLLKDADPEAFKISRQNLIDMQNLFPNPYSGNRSL